MNPIKNDSAYLERAAIGKRFLAWSKSNSETIKNYAQVLLLLVGTGWAFYTFIYENKIKLSNEPPKVTVSTSVKEVGRRDGKIALMTNVVVHNISKVRVNVYAAWFNVSGYRINRVLDVPWFKVLAYIIKPVSDQVTDSEFVKKLKDKDPDNSSEECSVSRFFNEAGVTHIHCGSLLKDSWLEPDEEYSRTNVVYIPADEYDLVKYKVDFDLAKDKSVVEAEWKYNLERGFYYTTSVRDEDCPACPSRPIKDVSDYQLAKYGIIHTDSEFSISVWEPEKTPQPSADNSPLPPSTLPVKVN
jgi:hypothetical protein